MAHAAICPYCGNPANMLGTLGMLQWFRCRACGMEFSRKVPR